MIAEPLDEVRHLVEAKRKRDLLTLNAPKSSKRLASMAMRSAISSFGSFLKPVRSRIANARRA
jgi:hypothetical protein